MPDASPFGHNLGFRMSSNTGRDEKQGENDKDEKDKDEKEEKSMKQQCSSKIVDERFFAFSIENTREKWVLKSGARPQMVMLQPPK